MRNEFDKNGECATRGDAFESLFSKMLKSKGCKVLPANHREELVDHIDFVCFNKDGNKFTVECKARKKLNRDDPQPQDDWIMIEFMGVSGHKGWLYGKADYIAFEQKDDVILVPRKSLVKLAEAKIDQTKWTFWSEEAKYCVYARSNRPLEKVGMLMNADILELEGAQVFDKSIAAKVS